MPYLVQAGLLLIEVIFSLVAFVFLLRLLLQWVGVSFQNPLCQGVYRLTNPVLTPLRRLLRPWRRVDLAALAVIVLLMLIKAVLMLLLIGPSLRAASVLLLGLAETLDLWLLAYFWMILIWVILGWIGQRGHHPFHSALQQIITPVLRPFRRILPAPGGWDFSPLLVSVLIALLRILLVAPLSDTAIKLATLSQLG